MIELLLTSAFVTFSFASKEPTLPKNFLIQNNCQKDFTQELKEAKNSIQKIILSYKLYPCHPVESLQYLLDSHSDDTWALSELAKKPILVNLSSKQELWLLETLLPYIHHSSQVEKSLLKIIEIKKSLDKPYIQEVNLLWQKFPSHNENNLASPDLSVVKDLKRRGKNELALELLKKLKKKDPKDLKIQNEMVNTQKNIKRNSEYLDLSLAYLLSVEKKFFKNKKNTYYRKLYLNEALLHVRRVWTYDSTKKALSRLTPLIRGYCNVDSYCAEHFWIKGRIYEELKNSKNALYWYKKAVANTPLKHSEYQNRVWNLVWLLYKYQGSEAALNAANKNLTKLETKEIESKLYYWMYTWAQKPEVKAKYKELLRTHHPMSFYIWSPLALGEGFDLVATSEGDFKNLLRKSYEKDLYEIIESHEVPLAHSFIRFQEKKRRFKKTMTWKKLKALSGRYADLQLDLEAKNISPEETMQFFFSRGFNKEMTAASAKFSIPKEILWSITRQESNFDPFARSWADAFGLMQILPKRADNFLIKHQSFNSINKSNFQPFNLYDPLFNVHIGAWLIQENLNDFNNRLPLAIAAYNASIDKVKEWEKRFYKPNNWIHFIEEITYRETRNYTKLVLRNQAIYQKLISASVQKKVN